MNPFEHYILPSSKGVSCSLCGADATHKIGEEAPHGHPANKRHNFTNYLCCACFGKVLGPTVVEWCQGKWPSEQGASKEQAVQQWDDMATAYLIDQQQDISIVRNKPIRDFGLWSVIRGIGYTYPSLLSKADRIFIILTSNCTAEIIRDTRFASKEEAYTFYQECKDKL